MLLKQMQYFISVVETKSFTEAAELCFISQSAISQAINQLEAELGVKLTVRKGRGFILTQAGELFYNQSKSILKNINKLKNEVQELDSKSIELRIGYLSSYAGDELQRAILEFSNRYPEARIDVIKGTHEDLYNLLVHEEISLALNDQRRVFSTEYENYVLNQSPAFIDILNTHPLAKLKKVTTKDLEAYPCILVSPKSRMKNEQDFYENSLGIGKQFIFADSLDEARLMVMNGRGFLLVESAKRKVSSPLVRLEVKRNDYSDIVRTYCAFWKKTKSNHYIEEFAKILREEFLK